MVRGDQMKKILPFLLVLYSLSWGITRDIVSAMVDTSGWELRLGVLSIDTGQTGEYAFNFDAKNKPTDTSHRVHIRSRGYSVTGTLGAVSRLAYIGTHLITHDSTGLIKRFGQSGDTSFIWVTLADAIFFKDSVCTLYTYKGLYRYGTDSTKIDTIPVVNNSLKRYWSQQVMADWNEPGWHRLTGAAFKLRMHGFHWAGDSGRQLKCVKLHARDEHGHACSTYVTQPTIDRSISRDSIPIQEYVGTLSTDVLTQGDSVVCNFTAYPFIGDDSTCLYTGDGVHTPPTPLYCPRFYICDKDHTYGTTCACVDSAAGSDVTGRAKDTSVYVLGDSCFATLGGAANAIITYNNTNYSRLDPAGNVDILKGTYAFLGATINASAVDPETWIYFRAAPGVSRDSVCIGSRSGSRHARNKMYFKRITIKGTDNAVMQSPADYIVFDSCVINKTGGYICNDVNCLYQINHCVLTASSSIPWDADDSTALALDRDTRYHLPATRYVDPYNMIGVKTGGTAYPTRLRCRQTSPMNPYPDQRIVAYCHFRLNAPLSATDWIDSTAENVSRGIVFAGNIAEKRSSAVDALLRIAADAAPAVVANNIIFIHNTWLGSRVNAAYDDHPNSTSPKWKFGWSFQNNLWGAHNVVTNYLGHGVVADSLRIGNWWQTFGVGSGGDVNLYTASPKKFCGIGAIQFETTEGAVGPGVLVNGANFGDTSLIGDYRLHDTSQAIGRSWRHNLMWDFKGNPRRKFGAAGAYESLDTLALFYGLQTSTPSSISAPCSTLAKVAGDSVKTYLRVLVDDNWITKDSIDWTTTATKDTLVATGLSAATNYPIQLFSVTTQTFGHSDSLSWDTVATASGSWDTIAIDSVAPDTVCHGDTLSIYLSASDFSVDTLYLDTVLVTPISPTENPIRVIIPESLSAGDYTVIVQDTVSSDTLANAFTLYCGTIYSYTDDTTNLNAPFILRNVDSMYIGAGKCLIVKDSLVYYPLSKVNAGANSKILTVPGNTITIKLNGLSNTPTVYNRQSKIKWR